MHAMAWALKRRNKPARWGAVVDRALTAVHRYARRADGSKPPKPCTLHDLNELRMPAECWRWVAAMLDDPRRVASPWSFPSALGRPIDRDNGFGSLRRDIQARLGKPEPIDGARVPFTEAAAAVAATCATAAATDEPTSERRMHDLAPLPFPYRCPVARMRRERGDVRPRVPGVLGARLGDRGTSTAIERNRAKAAATLAAQQLDATLRQQQQAPDAAGDAPQ